MLGASETGRRGRSERAASAERCDETGNRALRAGRALLRVLAINLAVLVALLVPLELYFGTWLTDAGPKIRGRVCDQLLHYDAQDLYPGAGQITYRRDQQCMRGNYDVGRIDIITVGGSTTDQRYLTEGLTWQDRMTSALAEGGVQVSVANAGVDGQSTIGHLWSFVQWFVALAHQPRFYLFYVGINDRYRADPNDNFSRKEQNLQDLDDWIKAKSAVAELYRIARGVYLARQEQLDHHHVDFDRLAYTDDGQIHDYEFYQKYLDELFLPRIRQLTAQVRQLGAEPIFVTQRSAFWRQAGDRVVGVDATIFEIGDQPANGVDAYMTEKLMSQTLMGYCHRSGIVCFDLFREVAFGPGDFYDYVHNTPAGAEKIGRYLADRLAAAGLF